MISSLDTVEIKAFIPAKDYEQSKSFYRDLGFTLASESDEVCYFHHGNSAFLLQNFYKKDLAENLMMHLLVVDVDRWWQHVRTKNLVEKYEIYISPPELRPWKMRDFVLTDPSGVLWRIAQNVES
jgi:catechol 2,3-dioxygenase-like lactoylglutathione lyase family enzyme